MPAGAPGQEELQKIFESVGFTTVGKSDHLYAPWSSVGLAGHVLLAGAFTLSENDNEDSARHILLLSYIS